MEVNLELIMQHLAVISVPASASAKEPVYLEPGLVMFGGIIFSVAATTVTVSFFLSGLKSAISEVNSRIAEIRIENKALSDQLLLRLNYREEEVRSLAKKLEWLSRELNSLTRYLNTELNTNHPYRPREEDDD